jgi:hypothetical protein
MPLRRETLAQRILDLIFLRLLKLDLTLAYILVYIKSWLHVQWDVLPCLSNLIGIELPVNCRLLLICPQLAPAPSDPRQDCGHSQGILLRHGQDCRELHRANYPQH